MNSYAEEENNRLLRLKHTHTVTQSHRTSVHMYTTDQKYGVSKNLIKKKTLTLFQILNFLIIK